MRLYEIPLAFRQWEAKIEDGELTPELEREFEQITMALNVKVDGIVALVRENDRAADAFRAEARAFLDKARARENLADRLKQYLLRHLKLVGRDRVDGLRFSVRVCTNALPTITYPDGGEVPTAFLAVAYSLDRDAAQKAFRAGTLPAGFEVTFGQHLRIR